jgi:hypothetical protein
MCKSLIFVAETMLQKMINFEQHIYSNNVGSRSKCPPRDFYDPNHVLAEKSFQIKPNEEILAVIKGSGFRYNDDTIYNLVVKHIQELPPPSQPIDINNRSHRDSSSGHSSNSSHSSYHPNGYYIAYPHTPAHLCLIIKNRSKLIIDIGCKTPLQWLLDMPRVMSELCYCSISELTKLRCQIEDAEILEKSVDNGVDTVDNNKLAQPVSVPDQTICLHF